MPVQMAASRQLRPVKITRNFTKLPKARTDRVRETKVICNASVEERVPPHLKNQSTGGDPEYAMMPRATRTAPRRDTRGPCGRTMEIQRLDRPELSFDSRLPALGERTITLDCMFSKRRELVPRNNRRLRRPGSACKWMVNERLLKKDASH